ncbi:unnamed protein product, partial [Symbiodinium microadriaticum]
KIYMPFAPVEPPKGKYEIRSQIALHRSTQTMLEYIKKGVHDTAPFDVSDFRVAPLFLAQCFGLRLAIF